jgi:hypothetical protein
LRKEDTIAISHDRKIFKAQTLIPHRPIQATIKQVLGGMFSGYYAQYEAFEPLLVQMMLAGARKWQEHSLRTREANHKSLLKMAQNLIKVLKFMMEDQVKVYLQAFTHVLFDQNTDLHWSKYSNNCQSFCDAVLHQTAFATLFPRREQLYRVASPGGPKLDYIMSFRTELQLGNMLEQSRLSIGPLTTFFKQLHNPTNVLNAAEDSVAQGADGNPSICTKLLAWNCQSDDCNLASHVWTNPAEFSSILQMHLLVDKSHYVQQPESEDGNPIPLTEIQWMQNRISVLQGIDSFVSSAAGIARSFQNRLGADESLMVESTSAIRYFTGLSVHL